MQMTPVPFWLMMVSMATAVLPVWRSPMMSSRWPRPTGIIESIALMPVWSGTPRPSRETTPGATCFVRLSMMKSLVAISGGHRLFEEFELPFDGGVEERVAVADYCARDELRIGLEFERDGLAERLTDRFRRGRAEFFGAGQRHGVSALHVELLVGDHALR